MDNKKSKLFPKLKKKIGAFLTDESWKITKKDAMWIALGATIASWINEASAAISTTAASASCTPQAPTHASWIVNGHYNTSSTSWAYGASCTATSPLGSITNSTSCTSTHTANWVVNGHFSRPTTVTVASSWHCSHGSHGSHGSHWSHWSHWSRW